MSTIGSISLLLARHPFTIVNDHACCFLAILSIPDCLKIDFMYNMQSVKTVFKKRDGHYLKLKKKILDMENFSDNS